MDGNEPGPEFNALVGREILGLIFEWPEDLPCYSTDIAAAWCVVDALKHRCWEIELKWTRSITMWMVTFKSDQGWAVAASESIPLAICRAALNLADHLRMTGRCPIQSS